MNDRSFRLAPTDIDQAFERNEFSLVFQPKVDLATSCMTGAEAFIRWQHPQYGLLPPGLFLDFIEAQGRIADLTGYVFKTAFTAASKWQSHEKDWSISINVAPGTVTADDFCQGLARFIQDYALKPERIIIEVPERAIAQEPDALCAALNAVRALGVQVALDGGGIVPVDLSQFVPMPFTSIKVGGPASIRLAQRLGLKGKGAIAARLRYARQFRLEAVAVGAEDEATMSGLAEVGFTSAQGIWIQKPLSLEELLTWDGKWVRGRVATDAVTAVALNPARPAMPARPRTQSPAFKTNFEEPLRAEMTKEEIQKVIEAVRTKRAGSPTLQPKPVHKAEPTMPSMDVDDLDDIVEDEEAAVPPGAHQGLGAPADVCLPMKGLVERRST